MGKLVQFQTSAVNMTLSLREQLRRAGASILEEFPSPLGPLIVSDIEWFHGQVRATEDELQAIERREIFSADRVIDQLPGKRVQIEQPVRLSLSTIQQLIDAGPNKPAAIAVREFRLIFNLRLSSVDNAVSLRISATRIEGEDAANPEFTSLYNQVLAQIPPINIPIDIAEILDLQATPAIANVGLAAVIREPVSTLIADPVPHPVPLPTESLILIRIEAGNPETHTGLWGSFFADPASAVFVDDAPRPRSWAVFSDEFFIREQIARNVEEALTEAGEFKLQGGISRAWTAPDAAHAHVHLDFYGRLEIECPIRMDVNVRIELSAIPAAPDAALNPAASPGSLHQLVKINHWKNDLDTVFCIGLGVAAWPFIGAPLMEEKHIGWFEYAVGALLAPAATISLISLANKGGLLPAPMNECTRPDEDKDEFVCDRPFESGLAITGARPVLRGLRALSNGMVLHGDMSWFERLGRSLFIKSIDTRGFQLEANKVNCGSASSTGLALASEHPEQFVAYSAFASVTFEQEAIPAIDDPAAKLISTGPRLDSLIPGHIQAMRVRPEDDPLNVFRPHVALRNPGTFGGTITLRVPPTSFPSEYFTPAHRYPCRVLIHTNVGARMITLAAPTQASAEEVKAAAISAWAHGVSNCYAKSKRWDPKWQIDPADLYREEHQWEAVIGGLQPMEMVALVTTAGQLAVSGRANRNGTALLRTILPSSAYDGGLRFEREERSRAALADVDIHEAAEILASRQHPVIDVRQRQLLKVAELPIDHALVDVVPITFARAPALALISREAITVYNITSLSNPVFLVRKHLPGVSHAAAGKDGLIVECEHGTVVLRFASDSDELRVDALAATHTEKTPHLHERSLNAASHERDEKFQPALGTAMGVIDPAEAKFFRVNNSSARLELFAVGRVAWT